MKFDVSKVYTAVNADELKTGDEVILADTISDLNEQVVNANGSRIIQHIDKIQSQEEIFRFVARDIEYALAYLVERKGENKDEIINKLKNEIKELKVHCRAVDDVNAKMKNCVNCKYSEDYDYYRDKKCCMCSSKYSKWELKDEEE